MQARLRKKRKIIKETTKLLRAGEKLAAELEIIQHENWGLRQAIIHEKKKRKRGKAMNLYDPDENEGQALFFSPAKIARVRQRNADAEQAERQRKQNASDKKLQLAIARAEKAREAEEKKNRRIFVRQAAREQVAREKAERQATREAKRVQKAADVAERRRIAAETKAQRTQVQKATIQTAKSKKRVVEAEGSERLSKRPRTSLSQSHNASISSTLRTMQDTRDVQLSDDTTTAIEPASQAVRRRNAPGRPISLPLRSGRSTNLPVRFRS
jgi:hypothetical protein